MADTPTRRLRPVHIALAAVLVLAIGVLVYEVAHIVPTIAGHGPPPAATAPSTTPQEARANAQGQSRDRANSSQDAYTSQNQSREPTTPNGQ